MFYYFFEPFEGVRLNSTFNNLKRIESSQIR